MQTSVPVIDLGGAVTSPSQEVVDLVADAAASFGFFQVVNHGIDRSLQREVWRVTREFFALPTEAKRAISRSKENARGYYDRELTKNKRDLKEVLDIGQLLRPDLPDDHAENEQTVDGRNQWPNEIGDFKPTITRYLEACRELSLHLLEAFARGLHEPADALRPFFDPVHSSFLRLNHYPVDDLLTEAEASAEVDLGDMALHHHTDSGALTLLMQDDVGGLQVQLRESGVWADVPPIDDAIVINTGDMMQVWSNDRHTAALHRVRPTRDRPRYSLPYFFNPSYETVYQPLEGSVAHGDRPHYRQIRWGDFRQARADGDFADYGAEIQIAHFRTG